MRNALLTCPGSSRPRNGAPAAGRGAAGLIALVAAALTACGVIAAPAPESRAPAPKIVRVALFQEGDAGPGLGADLSRAVIRAVQARTPIRVVAEGPASLEVGGTIACERPANGVVYLTVEVTWTDQKSGGLGRHRGKPAVFRAFARFRPDVGEARAGAVQAAIEHLAIRIAKDLEEAAR